MWRDAGGPARRLASSTDQLILRLRNEGRRPDSLEDADLEELGRLATELSELDFAPPPHFQDELAAQLRQGQAVHQPSGTWPSRVYSHVANRVALFIERWTMAPARVRAAFAAGAAVLLWVIVFNPFGQSRVVSAADVLMRSNEVLASTVHPGEVLYRKWRVQFTAWERPGATPVTEERMVEEWMDGADFDRVAGHSQTPEGWVRAYASHREAGQVRSFAFTGARNRDPQPALNIEPTQEEYLRAADTFAPEASRLLHTYLRRHFIYMPIAGERRFNREILEGAPGGPMPRSVTVDDVVIEHGKAAFAVRAVDPSRLQFLWQSGEPPRVQLAREEAISYIAKDSYLTIKSQRDTEYRSGRRTFELRTLEETRTYRMDELTRNPFEIKVPEGTRVNRQSAPELLTAILDALQKDISLGQ